MEDFPYIIDAKTKPLIAFGSSMHRLHREGRSHFSASTNTLTSVTESETNTYSSVSKKFPSKFGFSSLVSQTPRLQPLPKRYGAAVGTYLREPDKLPKQNYKPFNSAESLRREPRFMTPGPGSYGYHEHEQRPDFKYCLAFGKRRFIWPATAVFCNLKNYTICFYCAQQPIGDYFHNFTTKLNICRRCMNKQLDILRKCSTKATTRMRKLQELREFKPARYCDFYHNHQTEDQILTVISRAHLRKKIKLENYLYLYQPMWGKRYKL